LISIKSIYESGFLGDFDVEKLYYKVRTFYRGTKLYQNSSPNTSSLVCFDTIINAFFNYEKTENMVFRDN